MRKARMPLILTTLIVLMSLVVALAQAKTDTYNFSVGANFGDRNEFNFEVTTPGTIRAQAQWSGNVALALILNGPGQVGYFDRKDGNSPLVVTYQVTQETINKGTAWKISVVNFSKTVAATGNIRIEYPTASTFGPIGPITPVTPVLPPQHFDRFDRLSIASIEKTGNNAIFTVDYVLETPHSRDVFMGAAIMSGDRELPYFGFGPARVGPGSGRVQVDVSYRYNNPPASLNSDKVVVYLYEGGQKPFCKAINDLRLNWNK